MWDAIGIVAAAVIGAVMVILAVRVRVNFNLNDYLENRRTRKRQRQCQHYRIGIVEDGKLGIEMWFESPTGTPSFSCHRCGLTTTEMGVDLIEGRALQVLLTTMKDAGVDTSKLKWEERNLSD